MLLFLLHAAARSVRVLLAALPLLLAMPLAPPPRHSPRRSDPHKLPNAVPNLPHPILPILPLAVRRVAASRVAHATWNSKFARASAQVAKTGDTALWGSTST